MAPAQSAGGRGLLAYGRWDATVLVARNPYPPCPGDLNGDFQGDQRDLAILLGYFGCAGGDCEGDVDGDGDTDQADLAILLAHYGESCP